MLWIARHFDLKVGYLPGIKRPVRETGLEGFANELSQTFFHIDSTVLIVLVVGFDLTLSQGEIFRKVRAVQGCTITHIEALGTIQAPGTDDTELTSIFTHDQTFT